MTGLARAGKTVLLTSIAANLMARRDIAVRPAPAGAAEVPRFDVAAHVAALAGDPPRWPARTDAVSLLALDVDVARDPLPARRARLEFLDYPGEWLLDLPLLTQEFSGWSAAMLRRLEKEAAARDFLAFVHGLPAGAADEALARTGHRLYRDLLRQLRDTKGLVFLQPGRFLMPPPGPPPPWMEFFPMAGNGPLAALLDRRYGAYGEAVRRDLAGGLLRADRLVVVADVLSALHAGEAAFGDAAAALRAVSGALRWRQPPGFLPDWLAGLLPLGGISRVAFAASKTDHVAERQRGNLAALVGALTGAPPPAAAAGSAAFAIAAMRCTEDFVWTLEGRPVSAVRGRVEGKGLVGSYPGEVPNEPPDTAFWAHPFLQIPDFQPVRLPGGGKLGVPNLGVDRLLEYLIGDVL